MISQYELTNDVNRISREIESKKDVRAILFDRIKKQEKEFDNTNEAIAILVAVLSAAQSDITTFIKDIVTTALQCVYGDTAGYDFKVEFQLKRNQPEVILHPIKNGIEYEPKFSCGVGVLDVVSFALRVALWTIKEPRTSPILFFDEPFRNLHGKEENERIGMMVKELSDKLGLQIIIVTGESAITEYADKVFIVENKTGESKVRVI